LIDWKLSGSRYSVLQGHGLNQKIMESTKLTSAAIAPAKAELRAAFKDPAIAREAVKQSWISLRTCLPLRRYKRHRSESFPKQRNILLAIRPDAQ